MATNWLGPASDLDHINSEHWPAKEWADSTHAGISTSRSQSIWSYSTRSPYLPSSSTNVSVNKMLILKCTHCPHEKQQDKLTPSCQPYGLSLVLTSMKGTISRQGSHTWMAHLIWCYDRRTTGNILAGPPFPVLLDVISSANKIKCCESRQVAKQNGCRN